MKLQYASFLLPVYPESNEQEEINRFIRTHRIIQAHKELIVKENVSHWAILVEYLDSQEKSSGETIKSKVDYKEILNAEDFSLFSKLREIRKKLADDNGLPVYAVCTNEQLAKIAKNKPKNITDLIKIDGIGQGKADKYASAFLECIKILPNEKTAENPLF